MTPPSPNPTNLTDLLLQTLTNLPTPADSPDPPTSTLNLLAAKPTLLTLHALYPTLLLPALDVLDRRLITRLDLLPPSSTLTSSPPPGAAGRSIYHVRSAAPPRRHHRPGRDPVETHHSYEVRTTSWSCTCAAFAFAAFNQSSGAATGADPFRDEDEMILDCTGDDTTVEGTEGGARGVGDGKRWGGLMRVYGEGGGGVNGGVPVCKHLLACCVAECWDGAGRMVEVRGVGRGEMAGWAGGWGG
ncbi:MAG: hypothetical protein OHK93_007177 [Ramalina farinacea]|uniref:SWIM-type domain-containing protein n=1 Tax=Ramalina farinacea TaxID=258253 RepID=A0AA43TU54_9LECA|nr:hypothetical protein [Ramalina farinacea]